MGKKNNVQKRSFNPFTVFISTVVLLFIFAIYKDYQSEKTVHKEEPRKVTWNLISFPKPPPTTGEMPKLPTIMSFQKQGIRTSSRNFLGRVNKLLNILIDNHPEKEISETLKEKIIKQEVVFSLEGDQCLPPGTLASFSVEPFQSSPGKTKLEKCFTIQLSRLCRLDSKDTSADIYRFWAILSHENLHLLQYEMSKTETEKSLFHLQDISDGNLSEEKCRIIWENELAASRLEAKLARKWNLPEDMMDEYLLQLSQRLDHEDAFRDYFGMMMVTGRLNMQGCEDCLPVWAKLAGHPNPEEFKPI